MITVTDSAKQQIVDLCKEHKVDAVRLSVKGGGCAGFQYDWAFAKNDEINSDDEVFEYTEGKFVIDGMSVIYVAGTEVDYVREAFGSNFVIKNPSSKSSCGCGESFGV